MPREREKLISYDKDIQQLNQWYIQEERFILAVGALSLLMVLLVLATTLKLTSED